MLLTKEVTVKLLGYSGPGARRCKAVVGGRGAVVGEAG